MSTSHTSSTALHRDRPCNAIHRGHRTATPPSAISWHRALLPHCACRLVRFISPSLPRFASRNYFHSSAGGRSVTRSVSFSPLFKFRSKRQQQTEIYHIMTTRAPVIVKGALNSALMSERGLVDRSSFSVLNFVIFTIVRVRQYFWYILLVNIVSTKSSHPLI